MKVWIMFIKYHVAPNQTKAYMSTRPFLQTLPPCEFTVLFMVHGDSSSSSKLSNAAATFRPSPFMTL